MGLFDKLGKLWKRVSDLDDDSDAAKDWANEGDRIQYKDISRKLKEIMKENVDVLGRKILIPQYYTIHFSELDRKSRVEVEEVLCEELREELFHEMRKISPEQHKQDILIEIKTNASLQKGQFRIAHQIKKPTPKEQDVKLSQPKTAGERPATPANQDNKQTVKEIEPVVSYDDQDTIIQRDGYPVLYKLTIVSEDDEAERIITKDVISVGRSSKDDVVLNSPDFAISRTHAIIKVKNGDFYLLPSGTNGTSLNGEELERKKEVKVAPGDAVTIANYTLKISS
jgi:pSer/pThr/pTyr-binding forkhead associated (FHA) protein